MTRLFFLFAFFLLIPIASACPVCDSDAGRQVRMRILDDQFASNVFVTLLPFPILAGAVLIIHFGLPQLGTKSAAKREGNCDGR